MYAEMIISLIILIALGKGSYCKEEIFKGGEKGVVLPYLLHWSRALNDYGTVH